MVGIVWGVSWIKIRCVQVEPRKMGHDGSSVLSESLFDKERVVSCFAHAAAASVHFFLSCEGNLYCILDFTVMHLLYLKCIILKSNFRHTVFELAKAVL